MIEAMLTTVDNPHDPFDDFDTWYAWDEGAGYHSSSLLARIVVSSHEISESDQRLAIEQAIDEIVEENVSAMHRKVTREFPDNSGED
jgi:hypothetical protein